MSKAKQLGVELRAEAIKLGVWPCCLNCEHWRHYVEYDGAPNGPTIDEMRCTKYNVRPPDETIIVGCNQHIPYIPF